MQPEGEVIGGVKDILLKKVSKAYLPLDYDSQYIPCCPNKRDIKGTFVNIWVFHFIHAVQCLLVLTLCFLYSCNMIHQSASSQAFRHTVSPLQHSGCGFLVLGHLC